MAPGRRALHVVVAAALVVTAPAARPIKRFLLLRFGPASATSSTLKAVAPPHPCARPRRRFRRPPVPAPRRRRPRHL
eukprot:1228420-Prymnesium_polylepis.1